MLDSLKPYSARAITPECFWVVKSIARSFRRSGDSRKSLTAAEKYQYRLKSNASWPGIAWSAFLLDQGPPGVARKATAKGRRLGCWIPALSFRLYRGIGFLIAKGSCRCMEHQSTGSRRCSE